MSPTTRSNTSSSGPFIVSLDVGTSSVRSLLFDGEARQLDDFGVQLKYDVTTTDDGDVEVDGDHLADLSIQCLDKIHGQLQKAGMKASGVGFSAFWHSFLGIDSEGRPTTPIIHLFDTRSAPQAEKLRSMMDPVAAHQRTGCEFHTSYWPAKLLWLYENRASDTARTVSWLSFGEYLYRKLFGKARASTSMVSGSGLWNQNENHYDDLILSRLPVRLDQLARVEDLDETNSELAGEYKTKWPALDRIPWFPALGDGACNNLGSGCVSPGCFALMVGTSGAMRVVIEQEKVTIPAGLWCYRVDRKRFVMGGALSNGGDVFAWMRRTLVLPPPEELERAIASATPGAHGLTVLPFFAGERSPYWRADLRAVFYGLSLGTDPVEIVRAALESVALRFRQIYSMLKRAAGEPSEVVASGGALLHSPAWTAMMADALCRPVIASAEPEASGRGAALYALERLGAIHRLDEHPAKRGQRFDPNLEHEPVFEKMLVAQEDLYRKLWQ